MDIKEFINIYQKLLTNGAVLYGGGKEGKLAVEVLEEEGIVVKAVADQEIGKRCGRYNCISLNGMCSFEKETVCIITPAVPLGEIKRVLSQYYNVIIDNSVIHWIRYFLPKEENKEINYYYCFLFNHYESPYVTERELSKYDTDTKNDRLLGIDLNTQKQEELISSILKFGSDFIINLSKEELRYRAENMYYNLMDALVLHSMIRQFTPKKIIEIGSGFSTCVMLDTNEKWIKNSAQIICIEPVPDRLVSNIRHKEEQLTIKTELVQDVSFAEFEALEENDLLFIDSSHVTKACGDVPYEYFQILPRLKSGVLIHIHDIFYPFTYPLEWLKKGRGYTEAFLLRALLMNNENYEIVFFNHMMNEKLQSSFSHFNIQIPEGTSIYLRKR